MYLLFCSYVYQQITLFHFFFSILLLLYLLGCIPKVSPLAVECAGESCESVEGSLGDDDGETWSLNDDENYVEGS